MFLSLKELKFSKVRFFLIGFIMVLISWLVFLISGLANGLSADNSAALQNMKAEHFVIQPDAENKWSRSKVPVEKWREIKQQPSVKASAPLGQKMLSVTKVGSKKKMEVTIFATDAEGILAPKIVEGSNFRNDANQQVVVNISLKQEGVQLGDWLQDPETEQKWKVVGFTEGETYSHSPVIFLNLKDWENLLTPQKKVYYNTIALQMEESQVRNLQDSVKEIEVMNKATALSNIPGFKEEQGSLQMMIGFLFIIVSFVQAVFFYTITLQKTSQFGVLKAIGAKTSYLARNLIGQVTLLTIVAVLLSIGLTYGVEAILPESLPFQLSMETIAIFSLLLLIVSLLGSLLSLYRIAKIDAVEAIGRVE